MDGKCFMKLMKDSKMIGSRFTTTDRKTWRLFDGPVVGRPCLEVVVLADYI
jgi:hypothetical protein